MKSGCTRSMSWCSVSACGAASFSDFAGRTSTSSQERSKSSRRFSGSGESCGSSGPKTDDSERAIPLPAICVDALRLHKDQQKTEWSNVWPNWQENGPVFPSRVDTPLEPDNLRRSWGRIRDAAKLGDVRFHDIRHTCVSLLLDLGVPPHIVRDIVGHSDIEVTMTIYAHAALDEKRKALRKLGNALG
jgi:integrase